MPSLGVDRSRQPVPRCRGSRHPGSTPVARQGFHREMVRIALHAIVRTLYPYGTILSASRRGSVSRPARVARWFQSLARTGAKWARAGTRRVSTRAHVVAWNPVDSHRWKRRRVRRPDLTGLAFDSSLGAVPRHRGLHALRSPPPSNAGYAVLADPRDDARLHTNASEDVRPSWRCDAPSTHGRWGTANFGGMVIGGCGGMELPWPEAGRRATAGEDLATRPAPPRRAIDSRPCPGGAGRSWVARCAYATTPSD